MDRGAWWDTVHNVTESDMTEAHIHQHTHIHTHTLISSLKISLQIEMPLHHVINILIAKLIICKQYSK